MPKSQYKSISELKYLARSQTSRYMGILIGTVLLSFVFSYGSIDIISMLVPSNGIAGYILNYIVVFIAQVIISVLDVGVVYIFMKSACGMRSSIKDMFFGYQHHFTRAVKIGLVTIAISSICMIPLDIATIQFADIIDNNIFFRSYSSSGLGGLSDTYDMMESYSIFTSSMMKYYAIMFVCSVASSLLKLPFFPAYYMLLDFPNQSVTEILKKCFDVMHRNIFRLILLYLSFIPLILLSLFTCGIALIWVIPYIKMTETNFYLDLMAVRNRNM